LGSNAAPVHTLTSFFAVKFIMVRDLDAEEIMRPKW
jgi:hypothetical protein